MGVNSKHGVQSKRKHKSHDSCVCIAGFSACECQKSVVYKMECRHVAVQKGKQDQNHLINDIHSTETHTSDFVFNNNMF